jgi:signal transduction histidine kinase
LEATLQDLPLCQFQIDLDRLGAELAWAFEQFPLLVGATLMNQGQLVGMISRRQLLEYLIRPHGLELFLHKPLRVLYSYMRCPPLLLPAHTSILVAAQTALRRSLELQGEPILVQTDSTYLLLDIHALNIAYWQIRGIETQVRYERTQAQMLQSDKMASLGRLVDGVAHEILDPVSFIWGNLSHVTAYSNSLLTVLSVYEKLVPNPPPALRRLKDELEMDYVRQDLPQTIDSIRTGAERLSKLATSLQNFCHIDEVYPKPADLHELLDGILLLLKSRLSSQIRVVRDYGYLPPILCFAGQLNQVFMNILGYAVEALINNAVSQQLDLDINRGYRTTAVPLECQPTITITTQVKSLRSGDRETRWVAVCITDNGPGLSPKALKQLQESFSIECRALKETSLALSYQIVTAKHGGKFEVRSFNHTSIAADRNSNQRTPAATSEHCNKTSTNLDKSTSTGTQFEILLPLT